MSGTAGVANTFANAVTATGAQLDANYTTIVTYLNDPTNRNNYVSDAGTTNTVLLTFSPPVVGGYTAGLQICFKTLVANTGPVVVNASALGNKSLVNQDGSALVQGQLPAGSIVDAVYDGANFQMMSGGGINAHGIKSFLSAGTFTYTISPMASTVYVDAAAGGGGAGGASNNASTAAGGGGAGQATKDQSFSVTPGSTATIVIGAGGAGGASGANNGTGGGNTTVAGAFSLTLTAGALSTGANNTTTAGGSAGGAGAGSGGPGLPVGSAGLGGAGGSNIFAGCAMNTGANSSGATGVKFGGGGAGGGSGGGGATAGGSGADGFLTIKW